MENEAGKSRSVTFNDQCVMDYSHPDYIDPPETLPRSNMSSFALEFKDEPDETNGPIVFVFNFFYLKKNYKFLWFGF